MPPIENDFDTYNAECPRIRRPWNALSQTDKDHYKNAMLQIRKNGQGQIELDDLITVASVHQNFYGEIAHYDSAYLFWHGYLLWEMESRIRNLGGEYACFGMPYWDFSTEAGRSKSDAPYIFGQGLGGDGDPENEWTVNGYSWDVSVADYWVPEHCVAEGDEYPYCSLKRATSDNAQELSASETGHGIMENSKFADFSRWYSDTFNVPHNLLTNVDLLLEPVITSYDPIWYLFHSMVSYHQAIWTDCQNYDEIAPDDLDLHPEAYSPYCDGGVVENCGNQDGLNGMALDNEMEFGGYLPGKTWAYIYDHKLTVRKSYHLSRWNVVYDLKDDTFFAQSGLDKFCEGKLNNHWFMNAEQAVPFDGEEEEEMDVKENVNAMPVVMSSYDQLLMLAAGVVFIGFVMLLMRRCRTKKESEFELWNGRDDNDYGSV